MSLRRSALKIFGAVVPLVAAVGLACALTLAAAHSADAFTVFDSGQGQYGWTTPFSTPNDASYFVKTQGRCAEGHTGQMYFRDGNQQPLFGPVQVPSDWHFADGYGFQLPAGLPPGDYDVYVNCGNWNQIIVNQWITGPGTLAQILDYRDTAAPAGAGPAVTVVPAPPPTPAPSVPDSEVYVSDDGLSSSQRPHSIRPASTHSPASPDRPTVAAAPATDGNQTPSLDVTVTRETVPPKQPSSAFVAINKSAGRGHGGVGSGAIAGGVVMVAFIVFGALRRRAAATG